MFSISEPITIDLDHGPQVSRAISRIAAAVRAALARRKARYDAARLLAAGDRLLRDAGTTREDVRLALRERGGR